MTKFYIKKSTSDDVDSIGFQSRLEGNEVRDCLLILEPDNKCSLVLLTRPGLSTTVLESVVRGEGGVIEIDSCRTKTNRWPSNLILVGKAGVFDSKFPIVKSRGRYKDSKDENPTKWGFFSSFTGVRGGYSNRRNEYAGEEGPATRFFKQVQNEDELDEYLETLIGGS